MMEDFNFDDDVFTTTTERKAIPLVVDYQAKQETDGWFHHLGDPQKLMHEKLGPAHLKYAIEHDYLHGRYQQALEKALLFINIVDSDDQCKVMNPREVVEMAIHSAGRLEDWEQVGKLLDRNQTTYELGSLLMKGRFYSKCGRSPDAVSSLVEYSKQRKRDYNAWKWMCDACVMDKSKDKKMVIHLAHLTIQRALNIMTSFNWRLDIPVVKERYQREKQKMELKQNEIIQDGGNLDTFIEWIQSAEEKDRSLVGLDDYAWQDLLWIYKDWMIHLTDTDTTLDTQEEEEEQEKAVKDL
ncbi:uncharacterized protein BX664DRAFT_332755 [Halteromyces radiatus]|uniref:uncharacterized protein n=1 Tax=Halteromyces radiatus TaxID=101107 RepID=UPI002220623C|nr:uncharacterized protein BX664DRAFT_332755 [Halteromyces radiatus]KAI8089335.1 hypothetical protein BX664DRAFT_332755 [Halteromyces radiatus]